MPYVSQPLYALSSHLGAAAALLGEQTRVGLPSVTASGRNEPRAIRRSVGLVAVFATQPTHGGDYCFDQSASTEAADTRCSFVATYGYGSVRLS